MHDQEIYTDEPRLTQVTEHFDTKIEGQTVKLIRVIFLFFGFPCWQNLHNGMFSLQAGQVKLFKNVFSVFGSVLVACSDVAIQRVWAIWRMFGSRCGGSQESHARGRTRSWRQCLGYLEVPGHPVWIPNSYPKTGIFRPRPMVMRGHGDILKPMRRNWRETYRMLQETSLRRLELKRPWTPCALVVSGGGSTQRAWEAFWW